MIERKETSNEIVADHIPVAASNVRLLNFHFNVQLIVDKL